MRRAMIDTMVFDALHADPPARQAVLAAIRDGALVLQTTHVQEDQLSGVPDPVRRKALQSLPREVVPTPVAVQGVTRTGRARYTAQDDERIRAHRHTEDALIAAAAATHADVLVTEDRRLLADAHTRGVPGWRVAELVAWARAQPAG